MDSETLVDDETHEEPTYSADEREMLRRGQLAEDLSLHPGWKMFKEICEAQMEIRRTALCMPRHLRGDMQGLGPTEADDADEYTKGVLYGISLNIATIEGMINERKDILTQHNGDEE